MEMQTLESATKRSISEVLGKMFFLPLDFPSGSARDSMAGWENKNYMAFRLRFQGSFSGYFLFFIPEALSHSMAAGFLGEAEQNVTKENSADTVKEIINMIAGNTFSILDDQAIFNLEIPEMIDAPEIKSTIAGAKEGIFIPVRTVDSNLAVQIVIH